MPTLSNRLPTLTEQVENELETGVRGTPCMLELSAATHTLDRSGFVDRPGPLEHYFRETILAKSCAADQCCTALQRDRNSKWSPTCSAPSFSSSPPTARDGSLLRMWQPPRCVGQAQGCLPKVRSVAGQGCRSGTVPGRRLQRSGVPL